MSPRELRISVETSCVEVIGWREGSKLERVPIGGMTRYVNYFNIELLHNVADDSFKSLSAPMERLESISSIQEWTVILFFDMPPTYIQSLSCSTPKP
jgi:hypothetical protein